MKLPKVGVVVVNYNNPEDTRETLKSLYGANTPKIKLDIYLVNNGCTDLESSYLKEEFPLITQIDSSKNLGFGGGNNLGIKKALQQGVDYIMLVNNDIKIKSKDFFGEMLKTKKDLVAPVIYSYVNKVKKYDFGGVVDKLFGRNTHLKSQSEADYYSAACLLINAQVFKKNIFFDEDYFLYYEDVDFCLRAKKLGFSCGLAPNALVFHKLSASTNQLGPKKIKYLAQSHLRFCLEHLPKISFPFYIFFNIYLQSKRLLSFVSWQYQEKYKDLYPVLNYLYCLFHQIPQILVIGDSHVWPYYLKHPFLVFHLGGCTAYNIDNPHSSTRAWQKINNLLDRYNPKNKILIFSFGEIDCRLHIYNQYLVGQKKVSIQALINKTVKKYLFALKQIRSCGYRVAILSPTPTGTENNIYRKKYFANFKNRSKITKEFHNTLSRVAKANDFYYLDIYSKVSSSNGGIKKKYQQDCVHLNSLVVPLLQKELESIIKINE